MVAAMVASDDTKLKNITVSKLPEYLGKRRVFKETLSKRPKVGTAVGQIVVPPIVAALIAWLGWRSAVTALGVAAAVLLLIGALSMKAPPVVKVAQMGLEAGIPTQVSLERYMKCGFGICGQCSLDGFLVCQDGPVFDVEQLDGLRDFGKARRTATGRRLPLRNG